MGEHSHRSLLVNRPSRIELLIQEARAGSGEAVGELLEACRDYLLEVANRSLSAPLRVKLAPSDLVQETALDAQRYFANFHGDRLEELLAWLRSILLNNAASAGRRYNGTQKREIAREVPLAGCADVVGNLKDGAPSPGSALASIEEQGKIERAIARLPADQKTAILMRNRDRASFAEIGIELQLSANAARKLWVRAFERVQKELLKANGPF